MVNSMTTFVAASSTHSTRFESDLHDEISPSSWSHRLPIAVVAIVGLIIASYLAAYQLHLVRKVWDPFFGSGSERVLHSFVSRLLPVPDAVLGIFGYAGEIAGTLVGGRTRYRTHPGLICLYGGLVGVLAAAGVGLGAIQLFALQAGCTLCISSAIVSLVVAYFARGEVIAAAKQFRMKDEIE
jgi:uncharacterized membrane protein